MTLPWLITRPAQESIEFAEILAARGHAGLPAPVLRIEAGPDAVIDLTGVQALLFTSANGVRQFAQLSSRRDLPVACVGDVTAAVARELGFGWVASGSGMSGDLVRLAEREFDPGAGALWHGAGQHVTGEMRPALESRGFELRSTVLYQAVPVERLPDEAVTALRDRTIAGVLFFSPRTAKAFVRLVAREGLLDRLSGLVALCLSRPVAQSLLSQMQAAAGDAPVSWSRVRVAARPDRSALLALLDDEHEGRDIAPVESLAERPMTSDSDNPASRPPDGAGATNAVIDLFGGIRPMASKLAMPFTTVQGWKKRGNIPEQRHPEITAAAARHDIALPADLLAATAPPAQSAVEVIPAEPAPIRSEPAEPAPIEIEPVEVTPVEPEPARVVDSDDADIDEPAPPPPPPPVRPRSGSANWLAPAIAVLAAAVAVSAPWWAPQQVAALLGQTPNSQLAARLDALEATAEQAGSPAEQLAVLQGFEEELARTRDRLDELTGTAVSLEAAQATVADTLNDNVEAATAPLQDRLSALEDELARLDPSAALAVLDQQVAGVAAELEGSTDLADDLADLADRLAALDGRVGGLDTDLATFDGRVGGLSESIAALQGTVGNLSVELAGLIALDPLAGEETRQQIGAAVERIEEVLARAERLDESISELETVRTRLAALQETAEAADSGLRESIDSALAGLQALEGQLDQRDEAMAAAVQAEIEAMAATVQAEIAAMQSTIDADLAALGAALGSDVEPRLAAMADLAAAAEQRLAAMETALATLRRTEATGPAMPLAVGQLRLAIDGGGPFAAPLATLSALVEVDPTLADPLATLAPYAEDGVATPAQLADRFADMAIEVQAAHRLPEDPDWADRTGAAVTGLISVRPVAGEVDGGAVAEILARAESRVVHGDLAGAIEALGVLEGPAADAARPWLDQAEARLAANQALQVLTDAAIVDLLRLDDGQ